MDHITSKLGGLTLEQVKHEINQEISKGRQLLQEIETFVQFAQKYPRYKRERLEFKDMRKDIQQDLQSLEKLFTSPQTTNIYARLKASNLPFFQAIWSQAKRSTGVLKLKQHASQIHLVTDGGLTWIKVSTISSKRLLMDMAKEGWVWGAEDSEDESEEEGDERQRGELGFIKVARQLLAETKETLVGYQRPSVTFVLTRIREGEVREIDDVLNSLRSLGVTVIPANKLEAAPALTEDVMARMVHDEFKSFSETLNIDCTILLAIISDISHQPIPEEAWFNRDVRRQLALEEVEALMPCTLWPAMGSRTLVCTETAAMRMREITEEIGTETEKARMRILMGDVEGRSREELLSEFQGLSEHIVPKEWSLPMRVYESVKPDDKRLPRVAKQVAENLSELNRSVFLFGWAEGLTTLSGNRTAARSIQNTVVEGRQSEDEFGPEVWLSYNARSLLAKEKSRAGVYGPQSQ